MLELLRWGLEKPAILADPTEMPTEVTQLLRAHAEGDRAALERLAALVYPELKAMARRRAGGARMDATTLVNETFLKLLSSERIVAEDRKQFFGLDGDHHAPAHRRRSPLSHGGEARRAGRDVYGVTRCRQRRR
ncbi:MAG: ECF-type sigma factor [Gammaproteobacteria bacterium]|nr:ECF-type sigma factor [Gammaproteobacteria bacterium]